MKRSTLNRLGILLFLLIFIGCKVKKNIIQGVSSPSVSNTNFSKAEILQNITAKQANFNTLSIRAKADLDIDHSSNTVGMIIRIQKDKAIWISVTYIAGLEVARALITPDSIKIRDNIDRNYIKKPFSYIYGFTSKQVNFNALQSILAGNAMPEFLTDRSTFNTVDKAPALSGMLDNLLYSLTFNDKFRLTQIDLKDDSAGQTLTVTYGDFTPASQQLIPKSVSAKSTAANKNISVDLKYSRVDIDEPVDLPFNIPQTYTLKD